MAGSVSWVVWRLVGSARPKATRVTVAVFVVAAFLGLMAGPAAAWSASPSGSFTCGTDENGIVVELAWTATSWQPGTVEGENPSIQVEMSRDGGPWLTIGLGAFTSENGGQFGGSTAVDEGRGTIIIRSFATAPWGDGTIDGTTLTVELSVPTLEELPDDPGCEDEPALLPEPTPDPTPDPTPEPTPEPVETPTPEAEVAPEEPTPTPEVLVAPPPPREAPKAEVKPKELARTGTEPMDLALIALILVTAGTATFATGQAVSRISRRY